MMIDQYIAAALGLGIQFTLSMVFLVSGVSKLFNRQAFWIAINEYALGPILLRRLTAAALPFVEILLGMLWLSTWLILVATGSFALLVCFIAAMGLNMRRGRIVPCGCSGFFDPAPIGWGSIARNALLGVLVLIRPLIPNRMSGASLPVVGPQFRPLLTVDGALLAVTTTAFLFVFILLVNELINQRVKYNQIRPLLLHAVQEARNGS